MAEKKLSPEYIKKLDLMHTVMQKKMDNIGSGMQSFGMKISFLFGFTGIALISYLGLILQHRLLINIPWWLYDLRLAGAVGLGITLCCLLIAAWPRNFDDPIKSDYLYSEETLKGDYAYWRLKSSIISGIKQEYKNHLKNHEKVVNWFFASILLLFVSICLILLGILLWPITNQIQTNHSPLHPQIHLRNQVRPPSLPRTSESATVNP